MSSSTNMTIPYNIIDMVLANTTLSIMPKEKGQNPKFALHIDPSKINNLAEQIIVILNHWNAKEPLGAYWDIDEVSKALRLTKANLYVKRKTKKYKFPKGRKIGGKLYFTSAEIIEWMDSQKEESK